MQGGKAAAGGKSTGSVCEDTRQDRDEDDPCCPPTTSRSRCFWHTQSTVSRFFFAGAVQHLETNSVDAHKVDLAQAQIRLAHDASSLEDSVL